MPVPTAMEATFDQMLTDFSLGFMEVDESQFVSRQLFPQVDVRLQGSTFRKFERGYFLQDQVAGRPIGGVPREIDFRMDQDVYFCREEGLRAKLDKNERGNFVGPGDLREDKVKLLTSQHKIHHEVKFVRAFLREGVWSQEKRGVAGVPADASQFTQFDDATINLKQFWRREREDFAERTGVVPNVLLMGRDVLGAHADNLGIQEQIKYTSPDNITEQLLQGLLEIPRVLSPMGTFNSGVGEIINPATGRLIPRETYEFLVPKKMALLCYTDGQAGLNTVTAGVHFAWANLLEGTPFGADFLRADGGPTSVVMHGVWDYGEWFDVLQAITPQVVAPDLGRLYVDAVG